MWKLCKLGGDQFYVFKENCLQLPFDFTTSDEEMRYADCGLFITLCRSGSCSDMAAMFMFDNAMLYNTQYGRQYSLQYSVQYFVS